MEDLEHEHKRGARRQAALDLDARAQQRVLGETAVGAGLQPAAQELRKRRDDARRVGQEPAQPGVELGVRAEQIA